MNRSNRYDHIHIILVPGFGAFDALGSVEYYSGITGLFNHWRRRHSFPVTLHYFDNLPSAPVTARATRLRMYLAKRMARGEILEGDKVVLVGHSTGGLDIRQLVCDLGSREHERFHVDSGHVAVSRKIRKCLDGVVFLSVPHWGTNIADWVRSHSALRAAIIGDLRAAVVGSQVPVLDAIETQITGTAASLTNAGMLLALKDALTEANEHYGRPGPLRRAEAQEAASDLGLYFRQMWSDFDVIHDLACHSPHPERRSPAQFDDDERAQELELWDAKPAIRTMSFATVGGRVLSYPPGEPAPVFELTNPGSYVDLARDFWLSAGDDLSYRLCYRACAGGPFQLPPGAEKTLPVLGRRPPQPLEVWDNDGIVNTASMLWPRGEVVLVMADHLDIVGHYRLRKTHRGRRADAAYGIPRVYQAYDCLQSTPRFTKVMFDKIWTRIFSFATESADRAQKVMKPKLVKLEAA